MRRRGIDRARPEPGAGCAGSLFLKRFGTQPSRCGRVLRPAIRNPLHREGKGGLGELLARVVRTADVSPRLASPRGLVYNQLIPVRHAAPRSLARQPVARSESDVARRNRTRGILDPAGTLPAPTDPWR